MVNKNKKDSDLILKQKLEQMLVRKGYNFDIISVAVAETELNRSDEELDALRYQAEKLERKYASMTGFEYKQKMKSALYRKGFSLELIEKYLSQTKRRVNDEKQCPAIGLIDKDCYLD